MKWSYSFDLKTWKTGGLSEELAVDTRILLKWIIKTGRETAVRIHLAHPGCSHLPRCASGNELSGCTGVGEYLLVPDKTWNYTKSPSFRSNFTTFSRAAPQRRSPLRNFHLASIATASDSRASWDQPLEGVRRLFGIIGGKTGSTSGCRHAVSSACEHLTVGPKWAPQTGAKWCSRWQAVGKSARLYYRLSWRAIFLTSAVIPRRGTERHRQIDR